MPWNLFIDIIKGEYSVRWPSGFFFYITCKTFDIQGLTIFKAALT